MIYISGNSRVSITNSTFSTSDRYGLRVTSENGVLPDFKDNVIKHCDLYPIGLDNFYQCINFDASSDFSQGNSNNVVRVNSRRVVQSLTIPKLSGPYELHGSVQFDNEVEVEAGTHIKMAAGSRITINSNSSLKCIGTTTERIIFEGSQAAPGFFDCIRFNNTNNLNNEFQFVDVNYGGGSNIYPAAIYLSSSSIFKMGNSSVNHSSSNGISGSNNAVFEDDGNNTFNGNVLDDIDL
ncbi:MAG: hypothetical protein LAT54_02960 [Cryomorphaceae bacterium]|nr:hypothetical protein [Cryomorphaceae bacterium]